MKYQITIDTPISEMVQQIIQQSIEQHKDIDYMTLSEQLYTKCKEVKRYVLNGNNTKINGVTFISKI